MSDLEDQDSFQNPGSDPLEDVHPEDVSNDEEGKGKQQHRDFDEGHAEDTEEEEEDLPGRKARKRTKVCCLVFIFTWMTQLCC
jgi:hypothetical protein